MKFGNLKVKQIVDQINSNIGSMKISSPQQPCSKPYKLLSQGNLDAWVRKGDTV